MKTFIQSISRFNIVIFYISFCVSIIFAQLLDIQFLILILIPIIFLIFVFNHNQRYTIKILIFTLAFVLGILRVQYDIYILNSQRHIKRYIGQEVMIDGVVNSELDKNVYITKVVVKVNSLVLLDNNGCISRVYGRVLLEYDSYDNISLYDSITFKGVLKDIENTSSFDYKTYLASNNVYSTISSDEIYINTSRRDFSIKGRVNKAKNNLNQKMFSVLPSPHSELLMGILYGSGIKISDDLSNKMSNVGITHIMAVSGYNLSLLLLSTEKIAKILGRKIYTYFSIILIIFFMIFVGLDNIPVVRAGFMCITFLICQLTGRKRNTLLILSFNIFTFMLINPDIYKFVSFQLTFASTSGILVMSNFYKKVFKFLPKILLEDFASTISAISFTLPVIIFNFGTISIVSPVVNLFVLPVISLVTVGGLILVFLSIFNLQIVAFILGAIFWLMIEYVLWIVDMFNIEEVVVVALNNESSRWVLGVVICTLNLLLINISRKYYAKKFNYKNL